MFSQGPIFVSLNGPAGVGKTTTAHLLAPSRAQMLDHMPPVTYFNQILAAPIYEMVTTKRLIEGPDKKDRILYELHNTLDTLMARHIAYDDLVELVYDVYAMDAGSKDDPKPRTFMQTVGDMCRAVYKDCFVDAVIRQARLDYNRLTLEYAEHENDPPLHFVIVSDTRYANEVERLRETGNFLLVRLEASPNTLNERLLDRDGVLMSPEELAHPTEQEWQTFPEDWFDLILNTDTLDLTEQALTVQEFLLAKAELTEAK